MTIAIARAAAFVALVMIGPVGRAQSTEAIRSQDTNVAGIVGDIVQCKRKDGLLRNVDDYYVTAGEKEYFGTTG